jgi:hypothetical protein
MRVRRGATAAIAVAALAAGGVATAAAQRDDGQNGFKTTTKPYLVGLPGSGFKEEPLFTAGDFVPVTGSPGERYQFVGIPDGLGATREPLSGRRGRNEERRKAGDPATTVFVNHELNRGDTSQPYADRPGKQTGAFVDELRLAPDGSILSGRRAFDTEFQDDTQADTADSPTRAFGRFCSATLADSRVGFDRPIFLTGEEANAPDTFDATRGPQTVAIFTNDNGAKEAHALSDLGYFPKENTPIVPGTGRKTVAFSTEDGPTTPDSQLVMYVGEKKNTGTVLERNGLVGGKLYVFASDDPSKNSEATFDNGTISGHWVEIPKSQRQNEAQQEAASDAAGAFGFVRIEDAAVGKDGKTLNFVTTGNSTDKTINRLGVDYRLEFDKNQDPTQQTPRLSVVVNNDQVDAAGQDGPFSPDNTEVTGRVQAIQEDGTSDSRPEMGQRNRDGSIWLVDSAFTSTAPGVFPPRKRIAELTGKTGGKIDPTPRYPGIWESSGIIEVSRYFGGDGLVYLADVQAHDSTPPNGVDQTREDGQLLLLRQVEGR